MYNVHIYRPNTSGEEKSKSCILTIFLYYLPVDKGKDITWISSWKRAWPFICSLHKDALFNQFGWNCFWRRKKVVNAFSLCCYYLPLAKDYTFHLNKLESPTLLCAKYGWNWHHDSWREFEDVESFNDNDRYKGNFQSEKLTWAVQLRWAEYELIFLWK